MRILLNGLSIHNQSGTGRYTWGVIHGLVQVLPACMELDVVLPVDFRLPQGWKAAGKRTRFFGVSVMTPWQRVRWEQVMLPGFARRVKADVLHSPAFMAPIGRACPAHQVITLHDMAFQDYRYTLSFSRRWFYRFAIPASIRRADAIITDSLTVAEELNGSRYRKESIYPIPLGVDVHQFNPYKTELDEEVLLYYGIKNPYVLTVATLEPRKNLEMVVQAFRQACEQGYQGQLVLVGREGWKVNPERWKHPRIRRVGYVPEEHLAAFYRHAHAFLAPSRYEGFDLPCVESLACGTAVVASDIAVHREVLENSAFFLPVDDVDAWSEALLDLPDHSKTNYLDPIRTWEQVARDTLRVYEDVVEG